MAIDIENNSLTNLDTCEIKDLISYFSGIGVTLSVKGEKLICKLSKSENLHQKYSDVIKKRKTEIISCLNQGSLGPILKIKEYPLSSLQQGILFHHQMLPSANLYIVQILFEFQDVDFSILKKSWEEVIQRHDILRASFHAEVDGIYKQVISDAVELNWKILEFPKVSGEGIDKKIDEIMMTDRSIEYDFTSPSLMRFYQLSIAKNRNFLLWSHHHIILDGWSVSLLIKKVEEFYSDLMNNRSLSSSKTAQYHDFINWSRNSDYEKANKYWKKQLKNFNVPSKLKSDLKREIINDPTEFSSNSFSINLDKNFFNQCQTFVRKHGVTFNTLIQLAWSILISCYTDQCDVVHGVTVAGRNAADSTEIIGPCINTLPLRMNFLEDRSTVDLLKIIQDNVVACQEYCYSNLSSLKKFSDLSESDSLFYSIVVMVNYPKSSSCKSSQFRLKPKKTFESSNYPLMLDVILEESGVQLCISYNIFLYSLAYIKRLLKHYMKIFEWLLNNPYGLIKNLQYLTSDELKKLRLLNKTEKKYNFNCSFLECFETALRAEPNKIAIYSTVERLTYQQFNQETNQIANYLKDMGVAPGDVVVVFMPREITSFKVFFSLMKIGAVFVPIDVEYPINKLVKILKIIDTGYVIYSKSQKEILGSVLGASSLKPIYLDFSIWTSYSLNLDFYYPKLLDPAFILFTSGSTGAPKGVKLNNRGLMNHLYMMIDKLEILKSDVIALTAPVVSDMFIWQFLAPLMFGASVRLLLKDEYWDPQAMAEKIFDDHITVVEMVPSFFSLFISYLESFGIESIRHLKVLIISGETFPIEYANRWFNLGLSSKVFNAYGPTECSDDICMMHVKSTQNYSEYKSVPIGFVMPNFKLYVLDQKMRQVPIGFVGELYVAGFGLADGYLNNFEKSTQSFLDNPFCKNKGFDKLYRTGDLVQLKDDGLLEFVGRIDTQIQLHGYRVELGEIESVLFSMLGIAQCAALIIPYDNKNFLTLFYVSQKGFIVDDLDVRAYLKNSLPEYMLPSHIIPLDQMPVTTNGKIDRLKLAQYELKSDHQIKAIQKSSLHDEFERSVKLIWMHVLSVNEIETNSDFFSLGGNSLLAIQCRMKIQKDMQIDFSVRLLFENSKFSSFVSILKKIHKQVSKSFFEKVAHQRLPSAPQSYAQQGLWFLYHYDSDDRHAYNVIHALKLKGKIDLRSLKKSFQLVCNNHDVYKTVFFEKNGLPSQKVVPDLPPDFFELSDSENSFDKILFDEYNYSFNFQAGPLIRIFFLKSDKDITYLIINLHHIITDAWSFNLLLSEVANVYNKIINGGTPEVIKTKYEYGNYALWQQSHLDSEDLKSKFAYWKKQLRDYSNLDFPFDRIRNVKKNKKGNKFKFSISTDLFNKIKLVSSKSAVTLFSYVFSIFLILLKKYSQSDGFVVGVPIANRDENFLQDIHGYFIDMMPIKVEFDNKIILSDFVREVKNKILEGMQHISIGFEQIVKNLSIDRDSSISPVFQVACVWVEEETLPAISLDNIECEYLESQDVYPKYDLILNLVQSERSIECEFVYSHLFYSETIERLANHFINLINSAVTNPRSPVNRLSLIDKKELLFLTQYNNSADEVSELFPEILYKNAKKFSDLMAISSSEGSISYSELDRITTILSRKLRSYFKSKKIFTSDLIIAVALPRSIDYYLTVFSILKAGYAFASLDASQPIKRVRYILEKINAPLIISLEKNKKFLHDLKPTGLVCTLGEIHQFQCSRLLKDLEVSWTDLAYVVFTSGSTGRPKGVMISHGGLANLIAALKGKFNISPADKVLQFSSTTFDASILEWLMVILNGAELVIPDKNKMPPHCKIDETLQQHSINHACLTPVLLYDPPSVALPTLKTVFSAGDQCSSRILQNWHPVAEVYNFYGPSENTILSTVAQLSVNEEVSIGYPISNVTAYVLDENNQIVALGIVGELYLGGKGLALGYLKDEKLTQASFIEHPKFGRLYKTGDIVKRLNTGSFQFIGRTQNLLSIRGNRVDRREVESIFNEHEEVAQCVIIFTNLDLHHQRLLAYVVPTNRTSDHQKLSVELMEYASKILPEYMLPSEVIVLEKFPLTPHKKIDLKKLSEIQSKSLKSVRRLLTPIEQTLADLWKLLLSVSNDIDRDSHFFRLGGSSLTAMQLSNRIALTLQLECPVKLIFEYPVLHELAYHVQSLNRDTVKFDFESSNRIAPIPLSYGQQRIWFLEQYYGGSQTVYNMPIALKLEGKVNLHAFSRAVEFVVGRHDILRTVFFECDGVPYQKIISHFNISELFITVKCHEKELKERLLDEVTFKFDLERGPLLRVVLYELEKNTYVLLFNQHHIISDAWSVNILLKELSQVYNFFSKNQVPKLKALRYQYSDFSQWQISIIKNSLLKKQMNFWRELLEDYKYFELNTGVVRPAIEIYEGQCFSVNWSQSFYKELQEFSYQSNVSLFMLLFSGFSLLMNRYSESDDLVIGTTIANRNHPYFESMLGFFVNTLPLRVRLSLNDSFMHLLDCVKSLCTSVYSNLDVPFEKIIEILNIQREPSRHPLFQVLFELHNASLIPDANFGGLDASFVELPEVVSKFDLTFTFVEYSDSVILNVEYKTSLFSETFVSRMIADFEAILKEVIALNHEPLINLRLMNSSNYQQLVHDSNKTDYTYDFTTSVLERFNFFVAKNPNKIALFCNSEEIAYYDFDESTNKQANYLKALGVKSGNYVCLLMSRGRLYFEMLIAIWKIGAVFVPLNLANPTSKLNQSILKISQGWLLYEESVSNRVVDILKSSSVKKILIDNHVWRNSSSKFSLYNISPDDLAFILFTSGSTGEPKGVMLNHRGMLNHLFFMADQLKFSENDVFAQTAPLTSDMHIWQFLTPLLYGGSTSIMLGDEAWQPAALFSAIQRDAVTVMELVPSHLQVIIEYLEANSSFEFSSLRSLIISGEAFPSDYAKRFFNCAEQVKLYNIYGPTECSDDVCFFALEDNQWMSGNTVPIGKAFNNIKLYVLDNFGRILPQGLVGELHVSGVGLAYGYLDEPIKTHESFIRNKFSDEENYKRLYKTGDLVCYLDDFNLKYLGRKDRQEKIRGFRVELTEIESCMMKVPFVKQAAVIKKVIDNSNFLVAFYSILSSETSLSDLERKRKLSEFLSKNLVNYMQPTHLIELPTFPLTQLGKVDFNKLEQYEVNKDSNQRKMKSIHSSLGRGLVEIWSQLLNVDHVDLSDNFFEQGGHSLLATRFANRVQSILGKLCPVKFIFEYPVLSDLISALESDSSEKSKIISWQRVNRKERLPLSFSQQRLWFLEQYYKNEDGLYNIPITWKLQGNLNIQNLKKAIEYLINRHEILRTVFLEKDGVPYQLILESLDVNVVFQVKGSNCIVDDDIFQEARRFFSLEHGPLIQFTLWIIQKDEFIFQINQHHIISDAWSTNLLIRELNSIYKSLTENQKILLDQLAYQYVDFSAWQLERLLSGGLDSQLKYWKDLLAGYSDLNFSNGCTRPPEERFDGSSLKVYWPLDFLKRIKAFAHTSGVSLYMLLFAGFALLLNRYSQEEDLVIGTTIANRNYKETESILGFFVNTLPLRIKLFLNENFLELLRRVKKLCLDSYDNQDIPFEKIVDSLKVRRDPSRHPLFQVMFDLQILNDADNLNLSDIKNFDISTRDSLSKFDLTFTATETKVGLEVEVEYKIHLFSLGHIENMLRDYFAILEEVVSNSDKNLLSLRLMDKKQYELLINFYNDTHTEYDFCKSYIEKFNETVLKFPKNTAVLCNGENISYENLNFRTNRLANFLFQKGIRAGDLVCLFIERSQIYFELMLAVWKIGAAFVPIKVDYPIEKIASVVTKISKGWILADNLSIEKARKVVANSNVFPILVLNDLWKDLSSDFVPYIVHPNDLAFVLFTSGSTGEPKGVMLEHKGVLNHLYFMIEELGLTSSDVFAHTAPVVSDISIWQFLVLLIQGGAVALLLNGEAWEPPQLLHAVQRDKVTLVEIVPSHLLVLVEYLERHQDISFTTLRWMVVAGEAFPMNYALRWQQLKHNASIVNAYGPAECSDDVSLYKMPADNTLDLPTVPIGSAMPNLKLYVLDKYKRVLPHGFIGELYVSGIGLARGYLSEPEVTKKAFLNNFFCDLEPYNTLYRTGDLVRYVKDNQLIFIGRYDSQVQVRGYRVELGEIETKLLEIEGISQAVVAVKNVNQLDVIVAYISFDKSLTSDLDRVRAEMSPRLPSYMLPKFYVSMKEFPLNVSGKVDRAHLPLPEIQTCAPQEMMPLNTVIGSEILAIMGEVLNYPSIKLTDNFFSIGGDSLLAVQVAMRVSVRKVNISVRDIFTYPIIKDLIEKIEKSREINKEKLYVNIKSDSLKLPYKLHPAQKLFFQIKLSNPDHYNQSMLLKFDRYVDPLKIKRAVREILASIDIFHKRFISSAQQQVDDVECYDEPFILIKLDSLGLNERIEEIRDQCQKAQESLNIETGALHRWIFFDSNNSSEQRLFVVIHHLLIDVFSWQLLIEYLRVLLFSDNKFLNYKADSKNSYHSYVENLYYFSSIALNEEKINYWSEVVYLCQQNDIFFHNELRGPRSELRCVSEHSAWNSLMILKTTYDVREEVILLAAFVKALSDWKNSNGIGVILESNGRDSILPGIDTMQVVGWLTCIYPQYFPVRSSTSFLEAIQIVKIKLQEISSRSIEYSLLNMKFNDQPIVVPAKICFNYLGEDSMLDAQEPQEISFASEDTGQDVASENLPEFVLEVDCRLASGRIIFDWTYSCCTISQEIVSQLNEYLFSLISDLESDMNMNGFQDRQILEDKVVTNLEEGIDV